MGSPQEALQALVAGTLQLQESSRQVNVSLVAVQETLTALAQGQTNGPPRLRSPEHIMGLADLRPADRVKVNDGKCLVLFVARFCKFAIALQVPWTIETPARSYAWETPAICSLLKHQQCHN